MPEPSNQPKSGSNPVVQELSSINKQIYEKNAQLIARNKTLTTLRSIYDVTSKSKSIQQTSNQILDKIFTSLNFSLGIISIINKSKKEMNAIAMKSKQESSELDMQALLSNYILDIQSTKSICTKAISSKKMQISENPLEIFGKILGIEKAQYMIEGMQIKTILLYPLIFAEEAIGLLILATPKEYKNIPDADKEILSELIDPISIGIRNIQLYSQTQDQLIKLEGKNRELDAVFRITNEIITTLDKAEVAQRAVDAALKELEYVGAVVTSIDPRTHKKEILGMTNFLQNREFKDFLAKNMLAENLHRDKTKQIPTESINSFMIHENLRNSIADIVPDNSLDVFQKIFDIKLIVDVPIISPEGKLGYITFLFDREENQIQDSEFDLMQTFANQIGIGLENAKLFSIYRKLSASLTTKNQELKDYAQKEKDILDIMGHELRTPISIVRNSLSFLETLLQSGKAGKDKLKHYLDIALKSTRREISIIETMLAATKVEAGKIELYRQNVDVEEVISEAIRGYSQNAIEKKLELTVDLPKNLPQIFVDRSRIQEIVNNFVSNSVKYTHEGRVHVSARDLGDFVEISVQDTGIGIPEERLQKLGTKFYRVKQHVQENKDTRLYNTVRPGGTGLGLYVTFNLIKLHGGSINIISEFGKGSRFSFTIPVYKDQRVESNPMMGKDLFREFKTRQEKQSLYE